MLCSLLGALLVMALTIALLVPVGARSSDTARILVVDSSDSTWYATIGEAVAAARDGDRVLVRPARYVESVFVDKAISIEGDGDREAIVVEGPALPAFHVLADGASLRGLTLAGGREWSPDDGELPVLALTADATATDLVIADGAASGIGVYDSAAPTIDWEHPPRERVGRRGA